MADLVEIATKRLARRLSGHKIQLDLPVDLPPVSADSLLLEQAIFNVLDNAVKYSAVGTVIRIEAHRAEDKVLLTIADEGTGIPPDALPHIFDKFYRAKAADRRVAGTGLGLAVAGLCRGIRWEPRGSESCRLQRCPYDDHSSHRTEVARITWLPNCQKF